MNELELESELKRLTPASPSRALQEGIERELGESAHIIAAPQRLRRSTRMDSPRPSWFLPWLDRLLWSGFGATAALVLFTLSQRSHHQEVTQLAQATSRPSPETVPLDASALQPVLASEEDLGWRDEGVRFDAHGQPMLKLSRTAVQRQAWADLKNAGVVQMEQPREEVLWVPATFH